MESNTQDIGVMLAVSVALGLVGTAAIVFYGVRKGRRSTSSWVVSKLSGPEDRVAVRVGTLEFVWDPSKPLGIDNGLFGPGVGTYVREVQPVGDLIHLYFLRAGESTAEHHAGPIPVSAISGTAANVHARGARRIAMAMLVARLVILFLTAGLAFVVGVVGSAGAAAAVVAVGLILALWGPTVVGWIWMRKRFPTTAGEHEPASPNKH